MDCDGFGIVVNFGGLLKCSCMYVLRTDLANSSYCFSNCICCCDVCVEGAYESPLSSSSSSSVVNVYVLRL